MRLIFLLYVVVFAVVTEAGAIAPGGTSADTYSLQKLRGYTENKGQFLDQNDAPNPSVLYLLSQPGLNIQLKANSFSYDSYTEESVPLHDVSGPIHQSNEQPRRESVRHFHRVDIELVGANPAPIILAVGESADYQNYYTTGIGEEGATNVRSYERIVYVDMYPNIDLEFFRSAQGTGEYQFIIRPGGDASVIHLHYKGATKITLAGNTITLKLSNGSISEHIPKSYLAESGRELRVRYLQVGRNEVRYAVPKYSRQETLVIDPYPTLMWGTYLGGDAADYGGFAMTCDKGGKVYVTGQTGSANGIATSGAYQTTIGGNEDAFIACFTLDGACLWSTYYGGSNLEGGYGIASDNLGNICITGETRSSNAIATTGAHQTAYAGFEDGFIASFTTGGVRRWSTYYGGSSGDAGHDIAVSPNGNILVGGGTYSSTGIATAGAYKTTISGTDDGFIVSFSAAGVRQWGTYFGGSNHDGISGIAVDYNGNVVAAGETSNTSGIAFGSSIHQASFNGGTHDAFLAKFTTGGTLLWSTYYGGSGADVAKRIAADSSGSIFFTGYTKSTSAIATMGAYQPAYGGTGAYDAFLAKFSTDGALVWGTYYGDSGDDGPGAIALDKNGNVYISGYTNSSSTLFSTSNAFQPTNHGNYDAFIAQFNTDGVRLWGSYYGGLAEDRAFGMTVDSIGNIFITGSTSSTDGISTPGAFQEAKSGGTDGFVTLVGICNISGTTISSNQSTTFCLNDGMNIQYSVWNSPRNIYLWSDLRLGTIITPKTGNRITVNWTQAGIDTVRMRLVSPGGCVKDTFLIITITPALIASAGTDDSVCLGGSTAIGNDASGGSAPYSYSWLPKTGIIGSAATSRIVVAPTVTTDYKVMVTDTKGCYHEDIVRVTVHSKPHIVAGADTSVCAGTGIKIGTKVTGGTKEYTYKWLPALGLDNPEIAQPTASPLTDTTYQVIVTDINGCKDTSSIRIHVRAPATVLLPQSLDFGELRACTSDTTQTVTITNSGNEDLLFTRQNSSTGGFLLLDTLPLGIAKGETKTVTIRYAPRPAQGIAIDTVTLIGSPCSYQVLIPVKGTKSASIATTNKPGINFGTSLACRIGIIRDSVITIKNGSPDPMTLNGVRTAAPFTILSPQFPQTLAPQAELAITIRYEPTKVGVYSSDAELPFTSGNCSDTLHVFLRAEHSIPSVKITPNPFVFQDLLDCDPSRDTVITIDNPSGADVVVDSIISSEPQFKILTGLPFTIAAHTRRVLSVRFDPTRNGLATGSLTIVTNPCNQRTVIDLQGSKQGVSFNLPDTLNGGEIIGCAELSATIQLRIENTSSSGVDGSVTSISTSKFITTTLTVGSILTPSIPRTFDVTITPPSDGNFLDSMTIIFNPCGITKMVYVKGKRTNVTLKADIATLDFSKIPSGTNKPLPATFTNTGTTALTVSSVPNLVAPFAILSIAPPLPVTLQPNDKLTVTIQYTGTTGTQTSKVFAFAALPCAAGDSIALKGEGEVSALPSFSSTKFLQTDSICIGKDTLLTARLTNTGGVNLQVQQALVTGSTDFTVLGFTPQALASGNSIDVQVRYAPTAVGQATGKVVWVTDLLKDSTDLSGLGKSCGILPIDTAKTTITIENIEANTGDKVQIKLKLTGENGLAKSGATNFKAKIGFNRTILHITDPAIVCNSGTNADRCEVEITGTRQSGSDILAVIPAEATLGNAERTNLELLSFEWLNGAGVVTAARVNGELVLTDLCREGGVRLYQSTQKVNLSVVPNPVSGNAEIEYTLREESPVKLSLIDVLGREVMIIDEAVRGAGTYRKSVELGGQTGDGVYYLRLQCLNVGKTLRMSIMK